MKELQRKYKGVNQIKKVSTGAKGWTSTYKGHRNYHATEREAAIDYDKRLIRDGKKPVNILKPVLK